MKKALLILLLLVGIISCSDKEQIVENNLQTVKTSTYSVSYPKEFKTTKEFPGTELIIFIEDKDTDEFRENVNLLIKDTEDNFNKILQTSIEELKNNDFKIITNIEVIQSSKKYQRLIYTNDTKFNTKLRFEQLIRVQDGRVYILTATCEDSKYNRHEKAFKQILNNFKVN